MCNIFFRLFTLHHVMLLYTFATDSAADVSKSSHPGHLLPFGTVGPFLDVDEILEFPNASYFFEQYVLPLRPLKMVGAGKLSAAFDLWSDEYFLSADVDPANEIVVESAKKEKRSNPIRRMHFHEFLRTYNSTEQYMVDRVPEEFRQDIMLPGPLQCRQLYDEMLVEMIMWISSGGTSSVVHTDSVDNIICVYRGQKKFVMFDPAKYSSKIIIDHPEGAFSAVDVDRVDYTLYPGLADVEYYVVTLDPGDCFFVPYKWVHQVRSSDERSVAVNVWWNHHRNKYLDLGRCTDVLDLELTLDKVTFQGFESMNYDIESLREHFSDVIQAGVDIETFVDLLIGTLEDVKALLPSTGYRMPFMQIFLIIDKNHDKLVTLDELDLLTDRDWATIQRQMVHFDMILDENRRKSGDGKTYGKTEL